MDVNETSAEQMRERNCILSIRTTKESRARLVELQSLVSERLGAKLGLAQTLEIVLVEALRRERSQL